jgi:hypothetical protein
MLVSFAMGLNFFWQRKIIKIENEDPLALSSSKWHWHNEIHINSTFIYTQIAHNKMLKSWPMTFTTTISIRMNRLVSNLFSCRLSWSFSVFNLTNTHHKSWLNNPSNPQNHKDEQHWTIPKNDTNKPTANVPSQVIINL